ncbi:MAG: sucrase ferredoxin [Chloroflexi bacterium]|nr:sucrase ferredoxin [Chloroflexota bacterium]
MDRTDVTAKCYCNVLARQRGLDPVGSATAFEDALVVEIPLPWSPDIYEKAGKLPQEAINLLGLWLQRYREGLPYNHLALMIAPDSAYSHPGFRRVMYFSRPAALFAVYEKVEYLVPERELGALIWALFEAKADLPRFEPYRDIAANAIRDLLVCTHGTVDAACSKFGYPLYRYLRQHHSTEHLRIWRVSHFGGHVFAPTLLDLPTGHYWAYVEEAQAQQIVAQTGSVEALRGHYRGWAGLELDMMQAAERELWQREGWCWFTYPKQATILAQDGAQEPQWAEVHMEFSASERTGVYVLRVERRPPVDTEHSSSDSSRYPYPQYHVTLLEQA